ncbi:transglutaminase-like domain-containing protein [Xanthomarina spongicola]|uniref:Transglutaminase superfamily protein n=1 Tax=Xanthomarina spongicola TaxID=570520 RepID=A0A316DM03_9FLAO|nr:transglutaminase-like domain-containing protein [Xanthomarina spongicola]PWK18608.1 transglutaminase superfamily protein [Xanthomarina spongicola]
MILKKILWTFKRHPFLYRSRFKLLSKNSNIHEIEAYSYNDINEKKEIPKYFYEINDLVFLDGLPSSDLERVKKLNKWLVKHIKGGPGLSVPSEEALKIMLAGKGGVCSDMAQIFNNFCVINDIQVREWGSTRAPYEEEYGGHSYNEVYIKELNKWVFVDVSYGIMFYYNEKPLSVIEFYQILREGKKLTFNSFLEEENSYESSVYRNYLNPNTVPFLICNYSNKTYDKFLTNFRPYLPVFMIHFILYLLNKSYHYRFPLNDYKEIF